MPVVMSVFLSTVLQCIEGEHLGNAVVARCLRGMKGTIEEALSSGQTNEWLKAFRQQIQIVRVSKQIATGSNLERATLVESLPAIEFESAPASTSGSATMLQECLGHFVRQPEPSSSPEWMPEAQQAAEERAAANRDSEATEPICMDEDVNGAAAAACGSSALMDSNATALFDDDDAEGPTSAAASALSSMVTRLPSVLRTLPPDERGRSQIVVDQAAMDARIQRILAAQDHDSQQHIHDDSNHADEDHEDEEVEATESAQQSAKTPRRKGKKRRHAKIGDVSATVSADADAAAAATPVHAKAAAATTPSADAAAAVVAPLASLPPFAGIPVQLLRLGVEAWQRKYRDRQSNQMQHACDEAMAECMWHSSQITCPKERYCRYPSLSSRVAVSRARSRRRSTSGWPARASVRSCFSSWTRWSRHHLRVPDLL